MMQSNRRASQERNRNMGNQQDPAGAGSSAAAGAAAFPPQAPPGAAAAQPPVQPYPPQPNQWAAPEGFPQQQQQQQQYGAGPMPGSVPPHQQSYPMPPNYYAQQQQQQQPAVVTGRPPLVSIISPEDAKKIRKMQWVNFACTMVQLVCSLAIILLVRNNLSRFVSTGPGTLPTYVCFAAVPGQASTCEYAYSLASISIFFCFILSLMQCLTMDCCGMGRAVEAGFDAAAFAWWVAGAVTLGLRAGEANSAGIQQQSARNAVVALSWLSAMMFLALLVTNLVLIKKLGKAYKAAHQQLQQHLTAHPVAGGVPPQGIQMAAYPPQPGMYAAPAAAGAAAGGPAMYGAAQPMQQQQQQWGPPPGYPTSPPQAAGVAPTGHNAV
ncbi:hypothetical protein OEZ86_006965 [Tetradesmus obliquus]|nr:hypothetical protein OEZ86_006965 [Tetradesmus obliquus]